MYRENVPLQLAGASASLVRNFKRPKGVVDLDERRADYNHYYHHYGHLKLVKEKLHVLLNNSKWRKG